MFLLLLAVVGCAPVAVGWWLFGDLPDAGTLLQAAPAASTVIMDRGGTVLYEIVAPDAGRSEPVALADVPRNLQLATLATEDAQFYAHPGVDFRAILRAAYQGLRSGEVVSGASTITQQIARNLLLRQERDERSLRRKLREAALALLIEARYGKERILELYLNTTDYGRQSTGVQAAAEAYFGKPVSSLDLAECAFLAGLPQAPSVYDPAVGEAWRERQSVVLGLMRRQGFVDAEAAAAAAREPLALQEPHHDIRAPHFVMYVRQELLQRFGEEAIYHGGLRVYTTLDLPLQERSQDVLSETLGSANEQRSLGVDASIDSGAVLALDPGSGAILVMVGSPDYFDERASGAVNGTLVLRQPGSAIKPVTYAAAFEQGLSPATMVTDVPTAFTTAEGESYVPLNYDFRFHGPVLLREALASSYNVVAVKVLDEIGLPTMQSMARRLGIDSLDSIDSLDLAATLGGGEVSLLQLTAAYAVFANGGSAVRPYAIERVTDSEGNVLYSAAAPAEQRVLSPEVAYLLTDVLSDDQARIPTFGEESILALSRPAAVKTGTTTDFRDNWTVGYTPQVAVGVWVGNASGASMGRVSGVMGAAPVWHRVMETMLKRLPVVEFEEPAGIVHVEVCAESGLLPGPYCTHRRREVFIAGRAPTRTCDMHRLFAVDARTGYLADGDTPAQSLVQRVFTVLPLDALAWGDEHDIPRPPLPAPGSGGEGGSNGQVVVYSPAPNAVYALAPDLPDWSQRIDFSAGVATGMDIDEVRLLVDDVAIASLSTAPYTASWSLQEGEHTLLAEAITVAGESLLSEPVHIRVVSATSQ
ncbi:MAG: PBP1A family penicillin-binding protein [Anaerolineae bacterium]